MTIYAAPGRRRCTWRWTMDSNPCPGRSRCGWWVPALALAVTGLAEAETVVTHLIMPGTPYETVVTIKQGETPGPSIFVMGGCHGDEVAGYLAADRLVTWTITRGTLVLLPRAHVAAIKRNVRAWPGNMNAMFPGKADGSDMERLAYAIWQEMKAARPALVVTLHESRGFYRDDPSAYGQTLTHDFAELNPLFQPVLDEINPRIANPAHRFAIKVAPFATCPTYNAVRWLKCPATSIETCRQLGLQTRITHQLLILRAMLSRWGMEWEER
ncbi:MAG: hypothetical protein HPY69_13135 [Armatimonadetes bacterium]|nr:hypothetical protein [Armatimonadota bacterium]